MKRFSIVILFGLLISAIVGLPHLLIPHLLQSASYDPLQFTYGKGSSITMEEVYTYAPAVKEILEESLFVSDSQVYEHKREKTPFIGETGNAWIVAMLSRIAGSVEAGFIVSDFFFPFLTTLLIFFLTFYLSKHIFMSIVVASIALLWTDLIVLVPYPLAMWTSFQLAFHPADFLIMSRSFHPQISFPLYLLAVVLTIRALQKRQLPWSIMAGVASGLLFYSYIFSWTAFFGGFVMLGIILIFSRNFRALKHFTIIFFVAAIIAVPYIEATWSFRQGGTAQNFFQKLSLPKRNFFGLIARYVVFVVSYLLIRRKKWSLADWSLLAFWIAPLTLPGLSQELLGRDLEGKHWIRRIAYPMSTIGMGVIVASILNKKILSFCSIIILVVVLSRGAILQYMMSKQSAETYRQDKQKQEFFDWINKHTEPGTVIASLDWEMISSLPTKTHAYNFAPIGMRTIATTQEVTDRYLWTLALLGSSEEIVQQAFMENGIGATRVFYFTYAIDHQNVFRLPVPISENIISRYRSIQEKVRLKEKSPFRLNYLLVGPMNQSNGAILFKNDRYTLYRL